MRKAGIRPTHLELGSRHRLGRRAWFTALDARQINGGGKDALPQSHQRISAGCDGAYGYLSASRSRLAASTRINSAKLSDVAICSMMASVISSAISSFFLPSFS